MMGCSHLVLGAAGYLAVESCAPGLGLHQAAPAELAAGALVASGAAMMADLDHPSATVSRTLGPVTHALSRVVHVVVGGHRKGTHTIWAWLGMTALTSWALGLSSSPWIVLGVSIFAAALFLRVLTEADGIICLLLAAVLGGAVTLAAGHDHAWLLVAVSSGYALHLVGDVITVEGIPPLYPLGPQVRVPIIGAVGHWRERCAGAACGLVAFYLLVTMVFLPGWQEQQRQQLMDRPSSGVAQVVVMTGTRESARR
jgi:membrane-bound metal-dependent hydrolase YbcI (DUF457 family)